MPTSHPLAWANGDTLALFADLYELTMAQAYVADGIAERPASFSLFARALPPERNYLLACGLEPALAALEAFHFGAEAIAYLRGLGSFSASFLDWLAHYRFLGDVFAVPEGTPIFAAEPILEVSASLAEAQIIETLLINQIHQQTVLASKAARVVSAARGKRVVDFGARRILGLDAAVQGARAFAIGGVAATSNLLAGKVHGLPVVGTMAHSYVQAFASEADAFRAFTRHYPDTTLLVDTYDTLDGVRKVIALAAELGAEFRVQAVRLDSGDLAALARAARALLDAAGLKRVQIFASGGLDDHEIEMIVAKGAPIDAFGVGTRMGTSADAPSLDIVYKLTEVAGRGRLKLSPGKNLLPGRKQVFRREENGVMVADILTRANEALPGRALLRPVMRRGQRVADALPPLSAVIAYARSEATKLPAGLRGLARAPRPYPVTVSPALAAYGAEVRAAVPQ